MRIEQRMARGPVSLLLKPINEKIVDFSKDESLGVRGRGRNQPAKPIPCKGKPNSFLKYDLLSAGWDSYRQLKL